MALVKRYRRWYASLDVPTDVQAKFGKKRFIRTLDTESRSVAERRAPVVIAQWKAEIEQARGNGDDDIAYFRKALEGAFRPEDRDQVEELLHRAWQERSLPVLSHAPGVEPEAPAEVAQAARERADKWLGQVRAVRLADHLDAWERQSDLSPRTLSTSRKKVERVAQDLPIVDDCTRESVQAWVDELGQELARGTVKNYLGAARSLWRYLVKQGLAEGEPFEKIELPKERRNDDKRRPFTENDIKRLWMAADDQLKALIIIAAHTGMRLDEVCQLTVEDTGGDTLEVREGKSEAAARTIPVHSAIKGVVKRLREQTTDGYIISGLHKDRFGFRSNGIGERFSKLKRKLGYDERYVFHSIRKYVATALHEEGVPEPIAADILGHRITTLSYGVYAGTASMKAKREALEKAIRLVG